MSNSDPDYADRHPPVQLPSAAKACVQTKHFEEVLNPNQAFQMKS